MGRFALENPFGGMLAAHGTYAPRQSFIDEERAFRMTIWSLCIAIYCFITVFALVLTYREQRRKKQSSVLYEAIGFVACAFWPVAAAACLYCDGVASAESDT
jgi:hypothetical protein